MLPVAAAEIPLKFTPVLIEAQSCQLQRHATGSFANFMFWAILLKVGVCSNISGTRRAGQETWLFTIL